MEKEILKLAGLSDNEAEVYLLLLQLNESLASEIAEKSKISRPHIYDTIAKLIDKGLASYVIKKGKKYFRPADPEILLDYLRSKQESLQEIMPSLKKIYAPAKEKPVVEVFEGKEGLKNVLNDLLRSGKDFDAFGPTTKWTEEVPVEMGRYFKQREKTGFKGRLICPAGTKVLEYPLNNYKFLSKQYSSPATTMMYGDKTSFILWLDPVITVLVKNKELTESFKSYFELMWNQEVKILYGEEALKDFYESILKAKPEEYLIFGASGRAADVVETDYWTGFEKKRFELGIRTRRIYNDTREARAAENKYCDRRLREVRFNPRIGNSPIITVTYSNKVVFTSWSIKNPFFITIENEELAKGFRNEFESIWDQKELTYHGMEGVQMAMQNASDEMPDEIIMYGSSGASIKTMPKFIAKWHSERAKRKILFRVIYTDMPESRYRVSLLPKEYLQVRYLPGSYQSSIATMIYNDKVIFISVIGDSSFATVIDNHEFMLQHRRQFDALWKISKLK